MNENEIKEQMCEIGRNIWQLGFVAANDGNLSVRLSENEFFTTPTGVSKGTLKPSMIVKVDSNGKVLEGELKPSSELPMHLRVYKERPDVNAIVHAHPPIATAFAVAHIPLETYIMPEAILTFGSVPIAKYGTPSTMEVPESIVPYLQDHDVILLENHGALAVGCDLMTAYYRMETLEHYAKVSFYARKLGGAKEIPYNKLQELMDLRTKMNFSGRHPGIKRHQ
jgi:L-fuculose-phosphate aldolase